ncbi:hypothetical protein A7U60_g1928 [Sanghuangporus baumii]|uniref:Uncharacterized protein n=1 Tax=Sanghuangporus baumii TaxID=108892 RepID=A0A9Q5I361_SANBA|nr:hypothetical protein A7U60_g1928 [Sanghuangporus baumii]
MLSRILPSFLSLHTLFQLDMSQSSLHDDGSESIEVLLKFFAVIGGFFFLLLFYAHKNKLLYLPHLFWSLCEKRVRMKDSSKREGEQASEADLEKGGSSVEVAVQPSEEQYRGVRSNSHARVLAYLYTLPRESHDFLEMCEVSNCSSEERSAGQTSSDGDSAESSYGPDKSLESNWVEIVHNFPVPPGSGDLKVISDEWDAPAAGPRVVSDDTAVCFTKDVATPGRSEPTASSTSADGHC